MLWGSSHKLSPNPTNLHMPQSLIVPPDSATRSTSKTSENDANRPAKSQMVGSLLSAYDDHDDESDMDAEPAAAPEATADAGAVGAGGAVGAVPTVESRSWSNWEDMWLNCRYLQIAWGLGLSVLLQRRNVYMIYIYMLHLCYGFDPMAFGDVWIWYDLMFQDVWFKTEILACSPRRTCHIRCWC